MMTDNLPGNFRVPRWMKEVLRGAMIISMLIVPQVCLAQAKTASEQSPPVDRERASRVASNQTTPADREHAPKATNDEPPLTERERVLLELIRDLQERMAKLESQQALGPSQGAVANAQSQGAATPSGVINQNSVASISASQNSTAKVAGGQKPAILNLPPPKMSDLASADNGIAPPVKPGAVEPSSPPAEVAKAYEQPEGRKGFGSYTPNLGYKVADTEYGDINISIYTYVR